MLYSSNYLEAINYAHCLARASGDPKVESLHLLAGILHVEQSEVVFFLSEHGIDSEWFYKVAPKRLKKLVIVEKDLKKMPLNYVAKEIIDWVVNLILTKNLIFDLDVLIYGLLEINDSSAKNLLLKKLNDDQLKYILDEIHQMIFTKQDINNFNQVIIE